MRLCGRHVGFGWIKKGRKKTEKDPQEGRWTDRDVDLIEPDFLHHLPRHPSARGLGPSVPSYPTTRPNATTPPPTPHRTARTAASKQQVPPRASLYKSLLRRPRARQRKNIWTGSVQANTVPTCLIAYGVNYKRGRKCAWLNS